tara:strand:+ start:38 stop:379 length:342 start_codon:yes stop_codon:yes gene_type:complete
MKKVLVVLSIALSSLIGYSQEFTSIYTDSLNSSNGKSFKQYEFHYTESSIFWGKKGVNVNELKAISIEKKEHVNINGTDILYFRGTYGMVFFIDNKNKKVNVLFPEGKPFLFY